MTWKYRGYKGNCALQGVTGGYKGLQKVTRSSIGYSRLQGVTRGYNGVQGLTRGDRG